jgi:hypothetical protein
MFAIKDEFVTKFGKKERTREIEREKNQPCRRKFTVIYVRTTKINDTRRTTLILVEDRLDNYCCSRGGDFLLLFIKKRTKETMLIKKKREREREDAKV